MLKKVKNQTGQYDFTNNKYVLNTDASNYF